MEEDERSGVSGKGESVGDSLGNCSEELRLIEGACVGVGSTIFSDIIAAILFNLYTRLLCVCARACQAPSTAENLRPFGGGSVCRRLVSVGCLSF